jgi:hypothetical protein
MSSSIQTKDDRSRTSNPTILQAIEPQPESVRSVEKIHRYYIWSIFNLLFVPFGILCCYFSYKVNQFKAQNRYAMAKKWSSRTFVLNIMTTLLMAGVIITVVMLRYDYNQRHMAAQANQTLTTGAYIPWQPGR